MVDSEGVHTTSSGPELVSGKVPATPEAPVVTPDLGNLAQGGWKEHEDSSELDTVQRPAAPLPPASIVPRPPPDLPRQSSLMRQSSEHSFLRIVAREAKDGRKRRYLRFATDVMNSGSQENTRVKVMFTLREAISFSAGRVPLGPLRQDPPRIDIFDARPGPRTIPAPGGRKYRVSEVVNKHDYFETGGASSKMSRALRKARLIGKLKAAAAAGTLHRLLPAENEEEASKSEGVSVLHRESSHDISTGVSRDTVPIDSNRSEGPESATVVPLSSSSGGDPVERTTSEAEPEPELGNEPRRTGRLKKIAKMSGLLGMFSKRSRTVATPDTGERSLASVVPVGLTRRPSLPGPTLLKRGNTISSLLGGGKTIKKESSGNRLWTRAKVVKTIASIGGSGGPQEEEAWDTPLEMTRFDILTIRRPPVPDDPSIDTGPDSPYWEREKLMELVRRKMSKNLKVLSTPLVEKATVNRPVMSSWKEYNDAIEKRKQDHLNRFGEKMRDGRLNVWMKRVDRCIFEHMPKLERRNVELRLKATEEYIQKVNDELDEDFDKIEEQQWQFSGGGTIMFVKPGISDRKPDIVPISKILGNKSLQKRRASLHPEQAGAMEGLDDASSTTTEEVVYDILRHDLYPINRKCAKCFPCLLKHINTHDYILRRIVRQVKQLNRRYERELSVFMKSLEAGNPVKFWSGQLSSWFRDDMFRQMRWTVYGSMVFTAIGFLSAIISMNLFYRNDYKHYWATYLLQSFVSVSTLCLLALAYLRHIFNNVKERYLKSAAPSDIIGMSWRPLFMLFTEMAILIPHVPPGVTFTFDFAGYTWYAEQFWVIMLPRLYIFLHFVRVVSGLFNFKGLYLSGIADSPITLVFSFRHVMATRGLTLIFTIAAVAWVAYTNWVFTFEYNNNVFFPASDYTESLISAGWLVLVTLPAVGYGDVVPVSIMGRVSMIMCGFTGYLLTVCLTVWLMKFAIINASQFQTMRMVFHDQWKEHMRHVASRFIARTWRLRAEIAALENKNKRGSDTNKLAIDISGIMSKSKSVQMALEKAKFKLAKEGNPKLHLDPVHDTILSIVEVDTMYDRTLQWSAKVSETSDRLKKMLKAAVRTRHIHRTQHHYFKITASFVFPYLEFLIPYLRLRARGASDGDARKETLDLWVGMYSSRKDIHDVESSMSSGGFEDLELSRTVSCESGDVLPENVEEQETEEPSLDEDTEMHSAPYSYIPDALSRPLHPSDSNPMLLSRIHSDLERKYPALAGNDEEALKEQRFSVIANALDEQRKRTLTRMSSRKLLRRRSSSNLNPQSESLHALSLPVDFATLVPGSPMSVKHADQEIKDGTDAPENAKQTILRFGDVQVEELPPLGSPKASEVSDPDLLTDASESDEKGNAGSSDETTPQTFDLSLPGKNQMDSFKVADEFHRVASMQMLADEGEPAVPIAVVPPDEGSPDEVDIAMLAQGLMGLEVPQALEVARWLFEEYSVDKNCDERVLISVTALKKAIIDSRQKLTQEYFDIVKRLRLAMLVGFEDRLSRVVEFDDRAVAEAREREAQVRLGVLSSDNATMDVPDIPRTSSWNPAGHLYPTIYHNMPREDMDGNRLDLQSVETILSEMGTTFKHIEVEAIMDMAGRTLRTRLSAEYTVSVYALTEFLRSHVVALPMDCIVRTTSLKNTFRRGAKLARMFSLLQKAKEEHNMAALDMYNFPWASSQPPAMANPKSYMEQWHQIKDKEWHELDSGFPIDESGIVETQQIRKFFGEDAALNHRQKLSQRSVVSAREPEQPPLPSFSTAHVQMSASESPPDSIDQTNTPSGSSHNLGSGESEGSGGIFGDLEGESPGNATGYAVEKSRGEHTTKMSDPSLSSMASS